MPEDSTVKNQLRSAVEARTELGEEMEPAVIDAFLDRIERRITDRVDADQSALERKREHQRQIVIGSLAVCIPLLAIAAIFTGLAGVIAVCAALVGVTAVTARG